MIVVDASVILELLLSRPTARRIAQRILDPDETVHVPHLLDLEVAQVLRRYHHRGEISARRGTEALSDLLDLPMARYEHETFLPRIWELRHNLTAYDAAYVALAEFLNTPLLTADHRMAMSKGHAAKIETI